MSIVGGLKYKLFLATRYITDYTLLTFSEMNTVKLTVFMIVPSYRYRYIFPYFVATIIM